MLIVKFCLSLITKKYWISFCQDLLLAIMFDFVLFLSFLFLLLWLYPKCTPWIILNDRSIWLKINQLSYLELNIFTFLLVIFLFRVSRIEHFSESCLINIIGVISIRIKGSSLLLIELPWSMWRFENRDLNIRWRESKGIVLNEVLRHWVLV